LLALAFAPAVAQGASGDLDPGFGTGGIVTSDFGIDREEYGQDVAVDAVGRTVVVGGSETASVDQSSIAIARYTPFGTPDPAFSGDGLVLLNFGPGTWDFADAVAIDTNGRIVVAGITCSELNCSHNDIIVARLTNSGQLDPTFGGGDGMVTTGPGESNFARDLLIDPAGRVIVAGAVEDDLAVFRYTPAGTLDTSFSTDAVATAGFSGAFGYSVARDSQGRIIVAGEVNQGGVVDYAVARFLGSGALDPDFSGDGRVVTDVEGLGNWDFPREMAVDSQDRIDVVGSSISPTFSEGRFALVRYTANGSLDSTFGSGGVVLGEDESGGGSVAIDANERLLISAGFSLEHGGSALLRYLPTGSLDPTFGGGDGSAPDPIGVESLTIDPLRRIVVAGSEWNGSESDFAAARLLSGEPVPPTRNLAISVSGSGSGSVTGPGINCPSDCTESYAQGIPVALIASPSAGSTFAGWSGGCSGSGACEVTLGADTVIGATFTAQSAASGGTPITVSPGPQVQRPKPKAVKCRRGFKKRKVKGRMKCVKIKKKHRKPRR
jgi:uncharacterized delta-60 repeat protein